MPHPTPEQRVVELEALRQVGLSLSASLDLQAVLDTLLQSAFILLPQVQRADVFVYQAGRLTANASQRPGGQRGPAPRPPRPEGLTYTVARTGQPLVVANAHEHPLFAGYEEFRPLGAIAGLPLVASQRVVGVMSVSYTAPHDFAEDELRLLRLLGDQAAAAIENAWLFETTQRQVRELSLLHEVALAAVEAKDEDSLIERTIAIIASHLTPDNFGLLLLDDATGMLRLHPSYRGVRDPSFEQIPLGQGVTGRVAATGQPVRLSETSLDPDYISDAAPMRSELCVPLKVGDRVLGVFNAESRRPAAFSEAQERLLVTLAGQMATAVDGLRAAAAERRATLSAAENRVALHRASQELTSSLDLNQVYAAAHRAVAELLPCDAFSIGVTDDAGQAVQLVYARDHGQSRPLLRLPAHGLAAQMLLSGRPMRVDDLAQWPAQAVDLASGFGPSRSLVAAPLRVGVRAFGLLVVLSDRTSAFSPADEQTLGLLANQAAVAIEHARLYETEREQRQLAEVLRETGAILSASLDLEAVLDRLLELVARVVPHDTGTILLREGDHYWVARQQGYDQLSPASVAAVQGLRFAVAETATLRQMAETGEPLIVDDTSHFPGWVHLSASAHIRSWIGAPMVAQGEPIAAFALDKIEPNFYQPRHARHLATFAGQAALAVKNAQLFSALKEEKHRLELLYSLSQRLTASLDLAEVSQLSLDLVCSALHADRAELYLPASGPAVLKLAAWSGRDYAAAQGDVSAQSAGEAAASRAVLVRADFALEPLAWLASIAAVPLILGDTLVGVCVLLSRAERYFNHLPLADLLGIATPVALALQNAQLFDETRRRADELATLAEVSAALRAARTANDMLPIFLRKACQVTGASNSGIFLVEAGTGDLVLRASHPPEPRLVGLRHKPGAGITGHVAATGQAHYSADINADPVAAIEASTEHSFLKAVRSAMAVPLRTHEAVIGVLHVGLDHQRSFSSTEIQLLTAIAEVAGSALQRANLLETLEQRVEARTWELARANERLQELDRLKDQFISNVSHELRTPLTNIKLHLGLLEKRGAEVLPRYLPTLQRETERLRRLIDDLLDLSRLQAQVAPLRRERLAVDALLREVVALHIARAEARSLAIRQESAPAPLEINVDRHQMFQVFTNLLSNAVAYTPAGGQVRVSAGPAERGGRPGLEVIVHNTGVIPGEDLPHLFKRFFRGRTGVESGEAGTGLGLSISKEIVEQHEGRIAITSTPREGTTVTVWLPQIE